MFVLSGQATAGPESEYRTGDRHPVNVFVLAETMEGAVAIADAEMRGAGWQDIKFDKGGKLSGETPKGHPAIVGAFNTALDGGCGIVVYSDSVTAEENNLVN
ncbi:MAG: hypothetical protein RH942_01365 [Kiloniellaceae bacterium]